MLGQQGGSQDKPFYSFNLDDHLPRNHLLRGLDRFFDLGEARAREVFAAIAGTYDMRLGDAHPTSSKIGEALKLAGIDTTASYLRQGEQLAPAPHGPASRTM